MKVILCWLTLIFICLAIAGVFMGKPLDSIAFSILASLVGGGLFPYKVTIVKGE